MIHYSDRMLSIGILVQLCFFSLLRLWGVGFAQLFGISESLGCRALTRLSKALFRQSISRRWPEASRISVVSLRIWAKAYIIAGTGTFISLYNNRNAAIPAVSVISAQSHATP